MDRISMIYTTSSLQQFLLSTLHTKLLKIEEINGHMILFTSPDHLLHVVAFLKYHSLLQFKQLIDITAIDYPQDQQRFHIVYQFLSLSYNLRITLKVSVDPLTPLQSLIPFFSTANWFEREVWDLFGVFFLNHPDLRRLLTDYGFQGHPFRKDFPITGYYQVRYDDEKKRVVSEPVELSQQIRTFDSIGPWNQIPTP